MQREIKIQHVLGWYTKTPSPSAQVRCTPGVNNLPEISTLVPNYAFPANKRTIYPGHKETLSLVIFGKIGSTGVARIWNKYLKNFMKVFHEHDVTLTS